MSGLKKAKMGQSGENQWIIFSGLMCRTADGVKDNNKPRQYMPTVFVLFRRSAAQQLRI